MRNRILTRWFAVAVLLALCGCNRPSTSSNGDTSAANSSNETAQNSSAASPAPAPVPAPPVVIAAGKLLTVTIDQRVSTKTSHSGDAFAASLAEPVAVNGKTVLPAGTRATGTIVRAVEAGRIKGGAVLVLTLDGLTLHGRKYSIDTSEFEESGKGRGKRSAIGAGGGAAVGAIVGAIAGGGKGAAIGALAGGGAGATGAAFTGKRDITIEPEARIHFKLAKPLTISR